MKFYNWQDLCEIERRLLPGKAIVRAGMVAAGLTVLAGCVSGSQDPVQLGLADTGAVLDQPVHAVLASGEGGSEFPEIIENDGAGADQTASAVVPVPAPRTDEVKTASLAPSALTQTVQPEPATTNIQPVAASPQVQQTQPASTETDVVVQETQDGETTATERVAFASTEEPGVAKQGFFQRLFQSSQPRSQAGNTPRRLTGRGDGLNTASLSSRPSRKITTTPSTNAEPETNRTVSTSVISSNSAATTGGALPGVKSNAELFGVNEAEAEDEEIGIQVASVGGLARISPNGLRIQHEKVQVACLKPELIRLLNMVERHYGKKPVITSGYRSPKRNRRAGGARNSMHIFCKAADIQVEGVSKWKLAEFMRTLPGRGGVGTYCRTKSVHIDTGKKRDWHHPCRKSSLKKKKA